MVGSLDNLGSQKEGIPVIMINSNEQMSGAQRNVIGMQTNG